ncbi:MAG: hypothetical protein CM1200mP28_08410 [Deltaproteobacteria bacterium]|nr:MAG: hypothetical protein CM1200mP28_08410 [Deltaproteobacteria bacterium]
MLFGIALVFFGIVGRIIFPKFLHVYVPEFETGLEALKAAEAHQRNCVTIKQFSKNSRIHGLDLFPDSQI